jgi:hypothetical protein
VRSQAVSNQPPAKSTTGWPPNFSTASFKAATARATVCGHNAEQALATDGRNDERGTMNDELKTVLSFRFSVFSRSNLPLSEN